MGHHQLKDKELLIYDDLHLTVADSWALERETREQANSHIWMETEADQSYCL